MPFHLHTSNRLDRLADHLAAVVRAPLASPFTPETVVVQSLGMARWLKLELARRLGVCAHVEFPFPRAFADRLFRDTLPDAPVDEPFGREVMRWRLFRLLGDLPATEAFAPPRRYLAGGDARKRFQLAARLANLFDQYLVFRPDHIAAWDAGEPARSPAGRPLAHPDEAWQAALWRRVVAESGGTHPAKLHAALLRSLGVPGTAADETQSGGQATAALHPSPLPERLALFGISALPPFYLDLFAALGTCTEVHCFLLQPCAEWWGDLSTDRETERELRRLRRGAADAEALHLERGHSLLASLGPLGRDFLRLLHTHTEPVPHEDFVLSPESTLLTRLQRDLIELNGTAQGEAGEAKRTVAGDDDSIRVHNCHSPLRELEVLRDHLLAWLQDDPTLTPRDVLVMTPDLATYAPLVQAVFDSPEDGSQRIPYSLADRGPRQAGHIADTFLRLLRLPHSRLGVTAVLDLLGCLAVRTRFGLTDADLPQLRGWINATRIRWGRDARHRGSLGLPATEANTWRAGLRRLLLGYAMAGEARGHPGRGTPDEVADVEAPPAPFANGTSRPRSPRAEDPPLFAGVLPYDDIEGDSAELLGRFAEFAENLFAVVGQMEQPHPPAAWVSLLHHTVDAFFTADRDTADELLALRAVITAFGRDAATSRLEEPLPLAVVLEPLAAALDEDASGAGFLTGGVTFCALKPMRSIPFRVICLLGMNDGEFPRQPPRLGFDLMAAAPRPGDRSTRDDDRYLFLETLVSARERLHLSHVGQSIRDNSPLPPSVVVSELLDHLDATFTTGNNPEKLSEARLVVKHRLHAFSPAYFTPAPSLPLFSFSRENCAAAAIARATRSEPAPLVPAPLPEPGPERRQLTSAQLAEFLVHPARAFLRERLGLVLPDGDEPADDNEPFDLGPLEAYALRQRAVDSLLPGRGEAGGTDVPPALHAILVAEGALPHGAPGTLAFHTGRARAARFAERLRATGPLVFDEPVALDLTVGSPAGDFRLKGQLALRAGGDLLRYRCAKLKAKDLLRLWVEHLVWNAMDDPGLQPPGSEPSPQVTGQPRVSTLVAEDRTVRFLPVPAAKALLSGLLAISWRGLCEPLPFFPQTALAFVESERKTAERAPDQRADPFAEARKEWEGNPQRDLPGERDDAWTRLAFRHTADPLDEHFVELARAIFGPLLDHLEEVA